MIDAIRQQKLIEPIDPAVCRHVAPFLPGRLDIIDSQSGLTPNYCCLNVKYTSKQLKKFSETFKLIEIEFFSKIKLTYPQNCPCKILFVQ